MWDVTRRGPTRGLARELSRSVRGIWRTRMRPSQVTIDGLKLPLDPQLCSPAIRREINFETYEQDERRLIPPLVGPDDRVLEIGAGIGLVTAAIVRARPAASRHIEANAALIPAIGRTLSANGLSADVQHAAVVADDHHGPDITLRVGPDFWSSSLKKRATLETSVTVPAIRLSGLLSGFRPTLLVMDIEGAECDLLTGADLAGVRAIAVELHARVTGPGPQRRMLQHLLAQGFHVDFTASRNETVLLLREEAVG